MKLLKYKFIIAGIFFVASICAIGFVFFHHQNQGTKKEKSIEAYAHDMVVLCKDASYRPLCYETEVPKLVTQIPTERIFDVIRKIRTEDPEYLYCHVLAHKLGRYEVSLDPNRWLDAIAKGPTDGMCSNGFAHGAIVTRFNHENLSKEEFNSALPDLALACEPREGFNPTDLTKAICYHGIGHVLIHMTLADVKESLQACEYVSQKKDGRDYRQVCTEGVYMQLFQPLEPEDFALVDKLPYAPTKEKLKQFCSDSSSTDAQYGACYREAWPLLGTDIYESKGISNYCGQLTEKQGKESCFVSAFTINGRHGLGAPEKMALICNGMPEQYQGMCFARGANAFPEEDPQLVKNGIAFCALAKTKAAQDECYNFLARVAVFNFHEGSSAFEEMCSSLPSEFEKTCRGK